MENVLISNVYHHVPLPKLLCFVNNIIELTIQFDQVSSKLYNYQNSLMSVPNIYRSDLDARLFILCFQSINFGY